MEPNEIKRERTVSISRLKTFGYDRLSTASALRNLILSESDELPASEFLVKASVWLKLLGRQGGPSS
jgi:hypothetical protein